MRPLLGAVGKVKRTRLRSGGTSIGTTFSEQLDPALDLRGLGRLVAEPVDEHLHPRDLFVLVALHLAQALEHRVALLDVLAVVADVVGQGADDQRHLLLIEDAQTDLGGAADAADQRARVKCGADLVVAEAGFETLKPGKGLRKVLVHPLRRLAAARRGKTDGLVIGKGREFFLARNTREQNCLHIMRGKRLHDIGRTGKIIAAIGDEPFHASALPPNFVMDWASSGWSFA